MFKFFLHLIAAVFVLAVAAYSFDSLKDSWLDRGWNVGYSKGYSAGRTSMRKEICAMVAREYPKRAKDTVERQKDFLKKNNLYGILDELFKFDSLRNSIKGCEKEKGTPFHN